MKFDHLVIFPTKKFAGWYFRVSITDKNTIMVICWKKRDPNLFMIRFFTDEYAAAAFVEEAKMGKHSP